MSRENETIDRKYLDFFGWGDWNTTKILSYLIVKFSVGCLLIVKVGVDPLTVSMSFIITWHWWRDTSPNLRDKMMVHMRLLLYKIVT